ncbi:MAG: AI-2E family transporter, partial [Sphingobacteriaceae bacterium]
VSIFVSLVVIGGIVWFLSAQIADFSDDLPAIKRQLSEHLATAQRWIRSTFNISRREQTAYIQTATEQLKSGSGDYIQQTLLTVTDVLVLLILIPIYTFLLLYYKHTIRTFFLTVFKKENEEHVQHVLKQSKAIVQNYMLGLMIEMAIVAVLNAVGFLLIGIKYAIFLAVLAALLNLVPYIGMLVATVFCMLITLTSSQQFSSVAWTGVVLIIVQFIDNNVLMPAVVGNKVKINSLVTIIGVLIGGALADVSGMFLAIPVVAVLKTIFDRVEELKPWGTLMGGDE